MKIYLVTFVVGLTAVSSVSAQEPGTRGRGNFNPADMIERIFENDANSDGKISKDELPERMQRIFDRADGDSDGFITKDELTSMFEQRGGGGGVRRGGPGGGQGGQGGMSAERLMQAIPLFVALDADKNGELSKAEIENAVKALQSLDKNKDGKISTEEMMPDMSQFGVRDGGRGPGGRARGGDGRRARGSDGGGGRTQRPKLDE